MEPIMQDDVMGAIEALQWTDQAQTKSGENTVGPGIVFQSRPISLRLDASDDFLTFDSSIVDILIAFDGACLDAMVHSHKTLFPKSADMSTRDVEAMFNPYVKRPRSREVQIAMLDDPIIVGEDGAEISKSDFLKLARGEGDAPPAEMRCEVIIEMAGFKVDPYSFTPIIAVSEIALLPPPPPPPPAKRQSRLKSAAKAQPRATTAAEPEATAN